jgi:hypothetical protein
VLSHCVLSLCSRSLTELLLCSLTVLALCSRSELSLCCHCAVTVLSHCQTITLPKKTSRLTLSSTTVTTEISWLQRPYKDRDLVLWSVHKPSFSLGWSAFGPTVLFHYALSLCCLCARSLCSLTVLSHCALTVFSHYALSLCSLTVLSRCALSLCSLTAFNSLLYDFMAIPSLFMPI